MHAFIPVPGRAVARLAAVALGALAFTIAALSAAPAARADHPGHYQQWRFYGGAVSHGSTLRLFNDHIDHYLRYGIRDHGINLEWTTSGPTTEWYINRQAGCSGGCQVRYGDRFALWNTSISKYVKYGERDEGINLVWADSGDSGRFDWSIDGVGANGLPLTGPVVGGPRGLFNRTIRKHVIYHERDSGINLGWGEDVD